MAPKTYGSKSASRQLGPFITILALAIGSIVYLIATHPTSPQLTSSAPPLVATTVRAARAAAGEPPGRRAAAPPGLPPAAASGFAPAAAAPAKPIPPVRKRVDIADILEDEGKTVGAELGVLKGDFARDLLERWPSCKKYVLVDLWQQQENYVDLNNFPQKRQDLNLRL